MPILLVVNEPKDWGFDIPSVEVVPARAYLTDPVYSRMRGAKVFNLCRRYHYQATGYYVSLLAEARGHRPQPSVLEIQDFRSAQLARESSEELTELIEKSLAPIRSDTFELSVYFGRNVAQRYSRLSLRLFNLFPVPLLRAFFQRKEGEWELSRVATISAIDIPDSHKPLVIDAAKQYFERRRWSAPKSKPSRFDMAILHYPNGHDQPSDERALKKFVKAAAHWGIAAEFVTKNDYGLLAEYDALFIRETTAVNHHTFRFARRAESYGMVVMDDPGSILHCTNKVYLAELLDRHGVPTPKTVVLHRDNVTQVLGEIGLPCVLKQPDSSFSQGVIKVETRTELERETERLLSKSDLIIAQVFTPSDFDWRIGVIDRTPLFACRYFMADKHWQIVKGEQGDREYGKVDTLDIKDAPEHVVKTAMRAASLIGDGLYGVDLKEIDGKALVMEVNDNPNVNAGYEDKVLGDELYRRIMGVFAARLEKLKERNGAP